MNPSESRPDQPAEAPNAESSPTQTPAVSETAAVPEAAPVSSGMPAAEPAPDAEPDAAASAQPQDDGRPAPVSDDAADQSVPSAGEPQAENEKPSGASAETNSSDGAAASSEEEPVCDPSTRPEAESAPRFSRRMKIAAAAGAALLAAGAALWGAANWYVFSRPVPRTDPGETVSITVEDGDSATRVMARMTEAGLDVSPFLMRVAAKLDGRTLSRIHTGLYRFEPGLSPAGILETLARGAVVDRQLRIPDGAPVWEVMAVFRDAPALKRVSDTMTPEALRAALEIDTESLEGWFAPDTYHYTSGSSDVAVMKIAVNRQKALLNKAWSERKAAIPLATPYEALILASIIEKETGVKSDRHLVSAVFTNRLKLKMPLQTDPTVIYGLGPNWSGTLTKKDLQSATPYNTYKIPALPPTPISAPAYASIEAALHPADADYLYFVARGDGTSEFSKTLKAHNRAVRQYILNRPKDAKGAAGAAASRDSNK
ncbi:MAG: endolytic transglycosylase MltG [Sutterella sp.]|nr:endolytic transglycosylase MltG [Sutterella sp.]